MGRALFYAGTPGEKYQPGSGSEGEAFFASWCYRCARDKAMREGVPVDECAPDEICRIIARTMAADVEDKDYPIEWRYGADGQPMCSAFALDLNTPPTAEELEAAGQMRLLP